MEKDLRNMSVEELTGILAFHPWFGAAHVALCEKIKALGGGEISVSQCADAAIHVADRRRISSLLRRHDACQDAKVSELVQKCISVSPQPAEADAQEKQTNDSYRGVGDYFSQAQYAGVRRGGDDVMRGFVFDAKDDAVLSVIEGLEMDFCTETLAQIYADQGYYQHAKDIYSKLILAYPEKSAYFASLIEKLNQEIKN